MADVASDVAALDTVLFRFATVDNSKFPSAVSRVLPRVLPMLDKQNPQINKKVMEVVRHVNTRMREFPNMQLPIDKLIDVYQNAQSTLAKTISLVYVAKGAPNAKEGERVEMMRRIVKGVSKLRPALRAQAIFVFICALPGFNWRDKSGSNAEKLNFLSETKTESSDTLEKADRSAIVAQMLDVMLYSVNFIGSKKGMACPGLSPKRFKQLSDLIKSTPVCKTPIDPFNTNKIKKEMPSIARVKRGILGLCISAVIPSKECLPILLAASAGSGGGDSNLSTDSQSFLRRMGGGESTAKFFSLQDEKEGPATVLLRIFLGDATGQDKQRAAGLALRCEIIKYLTQSTAAANQTKSSIRVVLEAMFSPGSNDNLRLLGIGYLRFLLETLDEKGLARVCPVLFKGLLKLIQLHKKASASTSSKEETKRPLKPSVRSIASAYQVLGQMMKKFPLLVKQSSGVLMLFFKALQTEASEEIRQNVYEGVLLTIAAYKDKALPATLKSVRTLLRAMALNKGENVQNKSAGSEDLTQLAVVECCNRIFPFKDCTARLICLLNSNHPSLKVRRACESGLKPLSKVFSVATGAKRRKVENKTVNIVGYPSFPEMLALILKTSKSIRLGAAVMQKCLRFLNLCFTFNAKEKKISVTELADSFSTSKDENKKKALLNFQSLIEEAFNMSDKRAREAGAKCLLALVRWAPSTFATHYSNRRNWLKKNILQGSRETRDVMGQLLEAIAGYMKKEILDELLKEFVNQEVIPNASPQGLKSLSIDTMSLPGGLLGASILGAESTKRGLAADILKALCQSTGVLLWHASPYVVSESINAFRRIGSVAPLPIVQGEFPASKTEKDEKKKSLPLRVPTKGDDVTKAHVVQRLLALANTDPTKGRSEARIGESAVKALGYLSKFDKMLKKHILKALYSLKDSNHPEMHFAVGEALVIAANDAKNTEDLSEVIDTLLEEHLNQGSHIQRQSAQTWLLCIVKYGDEKVIRKRAQEIQRAFSLGLTESRQLTQECASKGLALLYQLGDEKTKEELLDSLSNLFSKGARKVNADTEIKIGVASEGKMATYKDLCNMATDIGQPDLVYQFLDLAAHHSVWNSKSGAAFSLGSILKASDRLRPSLEKLIPKLYRYKFDPDPKIRGSMQDLWNNLMKDSKTGRVRGLEARHFQPVMKELLKAMNNSQWRVRNSAATAMSSLIQGVRGDQILESILPIWNAAFRLVDDRKESVRKEGMALAKSLTSLSERLSNPQYTRTSTVKDVLARILPLLAGEDGITSKVSEVQMVSVSALVRVIKAGKRLVSAHLPLLVHALLTAMSTLEPQAFSYLQFHVSSMELSEEQMERLRVMKTASSPLQDALDTCLSAAQHDPSTLPRVASAIAGLVRQGLGLPTLTGCARFASRLVVQTRIGSGGLEVKNYLQQGSGEMMRAFTRGLKDSSTTVRKEYARTIGQLCVVAKPKDIAAVVRAIVRLYMNAELKRTTEDDYGFIFPDAFTESPAKNRETAGLTAKYMVAKALDKSSRFLKELLPVTFLAMHDPDKDVRKPWEECWNDATLGKEKGLNLYLEEITNVCLEMFGSPSYLLKKISVETLQDIVTICAKNSRIEKYIEPILKLIMSSISTTKYWGDKESVLMLTNAFAESFDTKLSMDSKKSLLKGINHAIQNPKRGGKKYLVASLICGAKLAKTLKSMDIFESARNSLEKYLKETKDNDDDDEKKGEDGVEKIAQSTPILGACLQYLSQSWPREETLPKSVATMSKHGPWAIETASKFQRGQDWSVRAAGLRFLKSIMLSIDVEKCLTKKEADIAAEAAEIGLGDTKYASVRKVAVNVIIAMAKRGGKFGSLVSTSKWEAIVNQLTELLEDRDLSVRNLAEEALKEVENTLGASVQVKTTRKRKNSESEKYAELYL